MRPCLIVVYLLHYAIRIAATAVAATFLLCCYYNYAFKYDKRKYIKYGHCMACNCIEIGRAFLFFFLFKGNRQHHMHLYMERIFHCTSFNSHRECFWLAVTKFARDQFFSSSKYLNRGLLSTWLLFVITFFLNNTSCDYGFLWWLWTLGYGNEFTPSKLIELVLIESTRNLFRFVWNILSDGIHLSIFFFGFWILNIAGQHLPQTCWWPLFINNQPTRKKKSKMTRNPFCLKKIQRISINTSAMWQKSYKHDNRNGQFMLSLLKKKRKKERQVKCACDQAQQKQNIFFNACKSSV